VVFAEKKVGIFPLVETAAHHSSMNCWYDEYNSTYDTHLQAFF